MRMQCAVRIRETETDMDNTICSHTFRFVVKLQTFLSYYYPQRTPCRNVRPCYKKKKNVVYTLDWLFLSFCFSQNKRIYAKIWNEFNNFPLFLERFHCQAVGVNIWLLFIEIIQSTSYANIVENFGFLLRKFYCNCFDWIGILLIIAPNFVKIKVTRLRHHAAIANKSSKISRD